MKTLKRKKLAAASLSAVTALTIMAITPQADAGVVWLASDDGNDLTFTTSGSLNTSATSTTAIPPDNSIYGTEEGFLMHAYVTHYSASSQGTVSPHPGVAFMFPSSASGDAFGHIGSTLIWDATFGMSPGTFTPQASMTFNGQTISSVFGTTLDSGSVLLWTDDSTNDTISIGRLVPVPEPSSTALLGLCGLALLLRRRR